MQKDRSYKSFLLLLLLFLGIAPHNTAKAEKSALPLLKESQNLSFFEKKKKCGKICSKKIYKMTQIELQTLLKYIHKKMNHQERLLLLTELFLGGKYKFGPLGEGSKGKWDKDPIYRLDLVDCVTFIETVMAFALRSNLREAIMELQKIRYKNGKISYQTRLHFTGPQWLVENQRAGYIKRISKLMGGKRTRYVSKKFRASSWKKTRWLRRIPRKMLPRRYSLSYIRLQDLPRILHKLPKVTWIGEVYDRKRSLIAVRHVGLLIRKQGQYFYRHANRKVNVTEKELSNYIRNRLRHQKKYPSKVQVLGFALASFQDPFKKIKQVTNIHSKKSNK